MDIRLSCVLAVSVFLVSVGITMAQFDYVLHSPDDCSEPMKVGPCRSLIPKYYYDGADNKCKFFNYGGCQANGNNFETPEECEDMCVKKTPQQIQYLEEAADKGQRRK